MCSQERSWWKVILPAKVCLFKSLRRMFFPLGFFCTWHKHCPPPVCLKLPELIVAFADEKDNLITVVVRFASWESWDETYANDFSVINSHETSPCLGAALLHILSSREIRSSKRRHESLHSIQNTLRYHQSYTQTQHEV